MGLEESDVILGLDPGTRVAGFGVVELRGDVLKLLDHGIIDCDAKAELPVRLKHLHEGLTEIFQRYRPQMAAVERSFVGKNALSALHLGHGRGICLMVAATFGATVHEYSPRDVKKGICGQGAADKGSIRQTLQVVLGRPLSDQLDATDAVSLAVHHAQMRIADLRWQRSQTRGVFREA